MRVSRWLCSNIFSVFSFSNFFRAVFAEAKVSASVDDVSVWTASQENTATFVFCHHTRYGRDELLILK